ncbi:MAG: DUF4338 domain-containing protein [Desulfovermiculus sp.]|nr:DUF4338 domain-containing protein [Desulfovermiculus sp.]
MEKKGLISLPTRKTPGPRGKKHVQTQGYLIDTSACKGSISDYSSLTFSMVRKSSKEKLWDHLVHTHHYLGKPFIVGSYLKYIAYLDGQIAACIGWGSAAWKVNDRDQCIGWDQQTRKRNLHLIADNVRLLILPWVHIPHLASKVLAANAKLLKKDWLDFYNVPLALLETFVDTARFYGTCYKAALRGVGPLRDGVQLDPCGKHFRQRQTGSQLPLSWPVQGGLCLSFGEKVQGEAAWIKAIPRLARFSGCAWSL